MRGGLVHSNYPAFCRWGTVMFRPARGKWIIVRLSDGGLATSFDWGKGIIHIFESAQSAIEFLENYKSKTRRTGLNGAACLVQLWGSDYWTCSPLKSPNFIEKRAVDGIRTFQFVPSKEVSG